MVKLFESIVFRGVELSNRIVVSPMGMYSAENGYVTPFHLVHYGKFAMGGAGLVFVEQTSVSPKGTDHQRRSRTLGGRSDRRQCARSFT